MNKARKMETGNFDISLEIHKLWLYRFEDEIIKFNQTHIEVEPVLREGIQGVYYNDDNEGNFAKILIQNLLISFK